MTACRVCGERFEPERPWCRVCPSCYRPVPRPSAVAPLGQMPGQLSLADTVEWAEASSPNVVSLRRRAA